MDPPLLRSTAANRSRDERLGQLLPQNLCACGVHMNRIAGTETLVSGDPELLCGDERLAKAVRHRALDRVELPKSLKRHSRWRVERPTPALGILRRQRF